MAIVSAETSNAHESRWTSGPALVLYVAAAALALQLLTAFRYGIFRDELYYLACAEHLDWGYVDHPPLTPLLAFLERHIGGESLLSIRFLPAAAFAVTVWLAGLIARQLGGGRFAQLIAVLAILLAPTYLLFFHLMTVNAFEPPLWMAAAYIVIRVIQTGNQKLWLWFGLIAGIGIENKYGMLFFGCGIAVGLLLTRTRSAFRRPWIWAGCAIALAIWLPNLVWEFRRHWPFWNSCTMFAPADVMCSWAPWLSLLSKRFSCYQSVCRFGSQGCGGSSSDASEDQAFGAVTPHSAGRLLPYTCCSTFCTERFTI
ncbi:MAG: glycosyltransferase family 39 protein [Acidobacteriia bacterium]|nr:glycosyltransferase family 39 protein [Terriglobia bacterium]